ncbi:MAG TPA: DNA polymerase Y family protein [Burkholderiales bacterium]
MWIAIRLPQLPLEIFLRGSSTPEPFAVEEHHRVLMCDPRAAARGIRAGMTVTAALALSPNLRMMPRDPAGETEALLGIAAWAIQFTPGVALEFPSTVLLELSGSMRLYGGTGVMKKKLLRDTAEIGYRAVIAGAPTPRAASWLAAAGEENLIAGLSELEQALAQLRVEIAGWEKETLGALRSIGVRTLGQLRSLPREGVARRFGQALLRDMDRAFGQLSDPRNFFVPPARFRSDIELPAEIIQAEMLLFAAKRLIVQLVGFLAARSGGVRRFVLKLGHRDRAATEVAIGLIAPSRDAKHFTLLLRERLSNLALVGPVRSIALEAGDVVLLPGRNLGLAFEQGKPRGEWEHLVERLRSRLGPGAVHGLASRSEHRPERASVQDSLAPGQRRGIAAGARRQQTCADTSAEFPARPFWLLEHPRPLAEVGAAPYCEGPLELLAGPERIESGWWDGGDVARDYFVARTQSESLVWIYREWRGEGGWYLHGVFA